MKNLTILQKGYESFNQKVLKKNEQKINKGQTLSTIKEILKRDKQVEKEKKLAQEKQKQMSKKNQQFQNMIENKKFGVEDQNIRKKLNQNKQRHARLERIQATKNIHKQRPSVHSAPTIPFIQPLNNNQGREIVLEKQKQQRPEQQTPKFKNAPPKSPERPFLKNPQKIIKSKEIEQASKMQIESIIIDKKKQEIKTLFPPIQPDSKTLFPFQSQQQKQIVKPTSQNVLFDISKTTNQNKGLFGAANTPQSNINPFTPTLQSNLFGSTTNNVVNPFAKPQDDKIQVPSIARRNGLFGSTPTPQNVSISTVNNIPKNIFNNPTTTVINNNNQNKQLFNNNTISNVNTPTLTIPNDNIFNQPKNQTNPTFINLNKNQQKQIMPLSTIQEQKSSSFQNNKTNPFIPNNSGLFNSNNQSNGEIKNNRVTFGQGQNKINLFDQKLFQPENKKNDNQQKKPKNMPLFQGNTSSIFTTTQPQNKNVFLIGTTKENIESQSITPVNEKVQVSKIYSVNPTNPFLTKPTGKNVYSAAVASGTPNLFDISSSNLFTQKSEQKEEVVTHAQTLFSKPSKSQNQNDQEISDSNEDQNELEQQQQESFDPTQAVLHHQYQESKIFYKQQANKIKVIFLKNTKSQQSIQSSKTQTKDEIAMDDAKISVQIPSGSTQTCIIIRLKNSTVAFAGTIIKGFTTVTPLKTQSVIIDRVFKIDKNQQGQIISKIIVGFGNPEYASKLIEVIKEKI